MGFTNCDDARLGGTLSSSGVSGGSSILSYAMGVRDWSDLHGYVGLSGDVAEVSGRPGGIVTGDLLGLSRFFTLNMRFSRFGENMTLTEPTPGEQLVANTDEFLALLRVPGQIIEVDMPDGTSRFTTFTALDRAALNQPRDIRTGSFSLISPWPYWRQGGTEETDTISGADTITIAGTAPVYDAVLVFSGDGTFQNTTEGWSIEVTGSGGPVTVDLGARTVTEGGSAATNRIRRDSRDWGWFSVGTNNVTSDVSVDLSWRRSYE